MAFASHEGGTVIDVVNLSRELARVRSAPARQMVLALVVFASIVLRTLWLDRLPGIDGDEAWYGVLGQHWVAGDFALWRTPNGNYPGPIQPALIALGHFVMPSEYILLRLPSVLSSLAAMILAWSIGRKHFNSSTARFSLLLMATLPANIAYARFGWDPSHSGVIILGGLACGLQRHLLATMALYALAVWTHPTNVFAAPLLWAAFAAAEREGGQKRLLTLRNGALAGSMALTVVAMMLTAAHAGRFANPGDVLARLVSPSDWLTFVLLFGRLLAGEPWFVHLAGTSYGALLPFVDALFLSMFACAAWYTVRTWKKDGLTARSGLLVGWWAMVASYALIGGSAALNAPAERYGFVLVAPTALVLAMTLAELVAFARVRKGETVFTGVIGAALLASTTAFYLVPLATRTHPTVNAFKTGLIEPKEAASDWIAAEAQRTGPLRVVAEDWWLYWPLAFRLAGKPVTLVDAEAKPAEAARKVSTRTFDVLFAGSSAEVQLKTNPSSLLVWTGSGYDGRPVVRIWERMPAL